MSLSVTKRALGFLSVCVGTTRTQISGGGVREITDSGYELPGDVCGCHSWQPA